MRKLLILSVALITLWSGTMAQNLLAQRFVNSPRNGCHANPSSVTSVSVPGLAFSVLPSADGCWVFASLDPKPNGGGDGGIAVIDLRDGTPKLARTFSGGPAIRKRGGLAITRDSRFLIATGLGSITVYDINKLMYADPNPVVSEYRPKEEQPPSYFGIAIIKNDNLMFVSDHNGDSVTVINFEETRRSNFQKFAVVGRVAVGYGAGTVVASPDGRYVYVTSQIANDSMHWEKVCQPPYRPPTAPKQAYGVVQVIDVSRASTDPEHSVLTTTPAGCDTVNFVLDGSVKRAYLLSRSDNQLIAFDASRLVSDPEHARLWSTPTSTGPIGLALLDHNRIAVANALRFSGGKKDTESVAVFDIKTVATQSHPTGSITSAGNRDLALMPDGKTLLVANYESGQITFIPVQALR